MSRKWLVGILCLTFVVVALSFGRRASADAPTALAYSINPSAFAMGSSGTTFVCMTQQTNPPGGFVQNDLSSIVFDNSLGTVTSVDSPLTVTSATLVPGDFTVALAANPNKIKITYTNASPKTFGFGESICATVHFTANVAATAAATTFSNKFTGTSGLLPSVMVSVLNPSLLPSAALTSTNLLPGAAPGSILVDRNTGSNPGNTLTL